MLTQKYKTLVHYTNKAGYDGIRASKTLKPSLIDDIKHTHYGKGVYFSPIEPVEIGILGVYEFVTRLFSYVTQDAIDKSLYYISVRADANWYPMAALDPKYHFEIDDIWLVDETTALDIKDHMIGSGETFVKWQFDMWCEEYKKEGEHLALCKEFAKYVNQEYRASKKLKAEPQVPVERLIELVEKGGRTRKMGITVDPIDGFGYWGID